MDCVSIHQFILQYYKATNTKLPLAYFKKPIAGESCTLSFNHGWIKVIGRDGEFFNTRLLSKVNRPLGEPHPRAMRIQCHQPIEPLPRRFLFAYAIPPNVFDAVPTQYMVDLGDINGILFLKECHDVASGYLLPEIVNTLLAYIKNVTFMGNYAHSLTLPNRTRLIDLTTETTEEQWHCPKSKLMSMKLRTCS